MQHLVDTLRRRRLWLVGLVVTAFVVPAALAADGVPAGAEDRGELAFQLSPQLREMVRGSQPVIDIADRIGGAVARSTVAVSDAAPEDGTLAFRPGVLLFRDGRLVDRAVAREPAHLEPGQRRALGDLREMVHLCDVVDDWPAPDNFVLGDLVRARPHELPVEESSFRGSANRFGLADAPGGLVVTGIGPRGIDSTWMVEPLVIRLDEADLAAY